MVILFDKFNLPEDIFEVIFATEQQIIVAEALMREMKQKGGELTKSQMSDFATRLHEGKLVTKVNRAPFVGKTIKLSYNKRQFYDRILTPMKSMGLIYYDLYKKIYKVSDSFVQELTRIGQMWYKELRNPPN
ncbi:MAG: hypothetical protein NTV63_03960 [Candidatus Woesearchaeota archaeon]|nr:hypothetical protein [Candidatus Woesearchaeota archaeon]